LKGKIKKNSLEQKILDGSAKESNFPPTLSGHFHNDTALRYSDIHGN
jgi:hypothetical protein